MWDRYWVGVDGNWEEVMMAWRDLLEGVCPALGDPGFAAGTRCGEHVLPCEGSCQEPVWKGAGCTPVPGHLVDLEVGTITFLTPAGKVIESLDIDPASEVLAEVCLGNGWGTTEVRLFMGESGIPVTEFVVTEQAVCYRFGPLGQTRQEATRGFLGALEGESVVALGAWALGPLLDGTTGGLDMAWPVSLGNSPDPDEGIDEAFERGVELCYDPFDLEPCTDYYAAWSVSAGGDLRVLVECVSPFLEPFLPGGESRDALVLLLGALLEAGPQQFTLEFRTGADADEATVRKLLGQNK